MLSRDTDGHCGLFWLIVVSAVFTVPFIVLLKDMAGSLRIMARGRSCLTGIKKYR